MTHKETVISWLNDAHALEHNLIKVLEHRIKDTEDHPEIQNRIQQHLDETHKHVELVEHCIKHLGGNVSAIKTGMANVTGMIQGISTGPAPDEMVKNALADYSSEHLEIASYTSLVAAAQAIGEPEIAKICETILQDEKEMAQFLAQKLPAITQEYLALKAREHHA